MNGREQRLVSAWREAWIGPGSDPVDPGLLPSDPLDLFALSTCLAGTLDALALRRARWLEEDPSRRLVFLLLSARLARGRTSARVDDLLADLRTIAESPSLPASDDPELSTLPSRLAAARSRLEGLLEDGLAGLDDDPDRLVRRVRRRDGDVVCFARWRTSEPELAARLRRRFAESRQLAPIDGSVAIELAHRSPALHDQQAEAVRRALEHRTLVVAGGPGTGKTTVVARILEALSRLDRSWSAERVALCAPTGRAKSRLQESIAAQSVDRIAYGAWTLHALLGPRPDGSFRHDSSNPLPFAVVVLDEASMVDQNLFAALVAALDPRTRWILLGDPDQLPSVEAGGTFAGIVRHLESEPEGGRPFVRLTHTWRNTGLLRDLAAEVNAGGIALATRLESDAAPVDAALERFEDGPEIRWIGGSLDHVLVAWWEGRVGRPADTLADSVRCSRVLCATHGGPSGRERINELGDRWLLGRRGPSASGAVPGRPMLLTRNLPSVDLWNGDLGELGELEGRPVVRFPAADGPRTLPLAGIQGLEPAWAITIHKAQGSEFDHVLLVLPDEDSPLLTRQILYTGLTRARRTLWIHGRRELWERAVARRDDRSSPLFDLGAGARED